VCFGALAAVSAAGWSPKLGLDLAGGLEVVYKPQHPVPANILSEAISIIRGRVDALGVSEPNIESQGNDIVVQLPGIKDPQQALSIIGQTAQLEYRPVLCYAPLYVAPAKGQPAPTPGLPPACSAASTVQASSNGTVPAADTALENVPSTPANLITPSATILIPDSENGQQATQRVELGPTQLTGSVISSATASTSSVGQWLINFNLTSAGTTAFNKMAAQEYEKLEAIVLDNKVISIETIASKSFPGSGQITGNFTEAQAKNLALVLNYGALPVQLVRLTDETVSPTLGKSSLKAGLYAGIGGLLLVLLYTIFYYRALGVVVFLGLATTAALLWAIVSILGHSANLALSLSGVTGMIVSIGITVDSYIVYFERLKDEVRAGKSIRSSVDKTFSRAYRTILAADLVSLISSILLYVLSTGDVRGFALFLGISTLLDIFSAYFFTRPLVAVLGSSRVFTQARWLGVARGLTAPEGSV
jgi:preprotein translocase subunit SecD